MGLITTIANNLMTRQTALDVAKEQNEGRVKTTEMVNETNRDINYDTLATGISNLEKRLEQEAELADKERRLRAKLGIIAGGVTLGAAAIKAMGYALKHRNNGGNDKHDSSNKPSSSDKIDTSKYPSMDKKAKDFVKTYNWMDKIPLQTGIPVPSWDIFNKSPYKGTGSGTLAVPTLTTLVNTIPILL